MRAVGPSFVLAAWSDYSEASRRAEMPPDAAIAARMESPAHIQVRSYGTAGPSVLVLHGGPGAPGRAAPIAAALQDAFRVLEPRQRGSGGPALTVARHVADLHDVVERAGAGSRPALVGESWGAMLALAYAAEHAERAGPIVLIGCGTFDESARAQLHATLEERTSPRLREQIDRVRADFPDPLDHLPRIYRLTEPLYTFNAMEPEADPESVEPLDVRAHLETWADMVRLQQEGLYPAAFAVIRSPVLMVHGAYDPHPGRMIRDSLLPHLPQLGYRELERCGHSPWVERYAREAFFALLHDWLSRHGQAGSC